MEISRSVYLPNTHHQKAGDIATLISVLFVSAEAVQVHQLCGAGLAAPLSQGAGQQPPHRPDHGTVPKVREEGKCEALTSSTRARHCHINE